MLKAMVRPGMTEASKQEVELQNIPPPVMEILLEYMYTGEVSIPHDKLCATVEASDYLQMLELKELCLREAVTVCKPPNVISWYKLAEELNIENLKSKCSEILSSSWLKYLNIPSFWS